MEKNKNRFFLDNIKRIVNAFFYSIAGLKAVFKKEASFRQELILATILLPVAILVPLSYIEKILMISSLVIVLIIELLNSAIEAIVDRVSPENHPLAKNAKDFGSAAVFLSLVNLCFIWCMCIINALI